MLRYRVCLFLSTQAVCSIACKTPVSQIFVFIVCRKIIFLCILMFFFCGREIDREIEKHRNILSNGNLVVQFRSFRQFVSASFRQVVSAILVVQIGREGQFSRVNSFSSFIHSVHSFIQFINLFSSFINSVKSIQSCKNGLHTAPPQWLISLLFST